MAITKNTLLERIKNELDSDYKNYTTLASALNSSDTSALVALTEGDRVSAGDEIEIGNEVMLVRENPMQATYLASALNATDTYTQVDSVSDLSAGYYIKVDNELMRVTATSASVYVSAERGVLGSNNTSHRDNVAVYNPDALLLTRGYQGSTAASAASGATVSVVDVWNAQELDKAVNESVYSMWNDFYQDYQVDTIASAYAVATSQGNFTAALPTGVEYIGKVKVTDNSGAVQGYVTDFNVRQGASDGAYVLEVNEVVNSGYYLWPYGAQRYAFDGSDNLDIPAYLEEYVVKYSVMNLIEKRLPDLLRYEKYSAKTGREDGTRLDYLRVLDNYRSRVSAIVQNHGKSLDAQELNFGQNT